MSGNVVTFPEKPQPRSLGVRLRPSTQVDGEFEVQRCEDGVWRAKSVHASQEEADREAKKLVELVILERMAIDDGNAHPMELAGRLPDLILLGTQQESGTYLLLWHEGAKGTFHLTRFVQGQEQYGYRFSTFGEALDAAEMCNRLGGIDVEISGGL